MIRHARTAYAFLAVPLAVLFLFTLVPTPNDGQHDGLRKVVEARQPKVIGINTSDAWNHADGLTANEKDRLSTALGPAFAKRMKSAEMLAVGWLEAKLAAETEAYRHVMRIAHRVIREAGCPVLTLHSVSADVFEPKKPSV